MQPAITVIITLILVALVILGFWFCWTKMMEQQLVKVAVLGQRRRERRATATAGAEGGGEGGAGAGGSVAGTAVHEGV